MQNNWAEETAQGLISQTAIRKGICLILGASDTGKTTLAMALAKYLSEMRAVGIIDADIGQSHIGPPTTVGWTIVDKPDEDLTRLRAHGISFVGDVTPVRHLLQLTAAIVLCVEQASETADLLVIDTPGLVTGSAAAALWWTVQHMLRPQLVVAVQRHNELADILVGLRSAGSQLELVKCPPEIPAKSPADRRVYRQEQFAEYFRASRFYDFDLSTIGLQATSDSTNQDLAGRIVGLRNHNGLDTAIGIVTDWQIEKNIAVIKAPALDKRQIRCLVIGDTKIEIS